MITFKDNLETDIITFISLITSPQKKKIISLILNVQKQVIFQIFAIHIQIIQLSLHHTRLTLTHTHTRRMLIQILAIKQKVTIHTYR